MKKMLSVVLALVLVFALFAGCSGSSTDSDDTSPDSSDTPSGSSATPVGSGSDNSEETYTLTFSYFGPETITPSVGSLEGFEKATEMSGGRLQFESYFSGTLLPSEDSISGCQNGTADIVFVEGTQIGEVFELNNIFSMGYTATPPSRTATTAVYRQLLKDSPEIQEELATQNLTWLSLLAIGGYCLHGTDTVFNSPSDVSGKSIDALGKGLLLIDAMGGVGSAMDPGDYYLSLDTGLLDGQATHMVGLLHYGTQEILKTHTVFVNNDEDFSDNGGGLYSPAMGYVMNLTSFNKLPADLQQILIECCDYAGDYIIESDTPDFATVLKLCEDRGDTFVYVTDAERGVWNEYILKVVDEWETACADKGYDGEAAYTHLMELFETV